MKSERAKVLHEVAGRPMIAWAVETARAAGAERVVAILGHQFDAVKAMLDGRYGAGRDRRRAAGRAQGHRPRRPVRAADPRARGRRSHRRDPVGRRAALARRARRRAGRGVRGQPGRPGAPVDRARSAHALRSPGPRRRRRAAAHRRARRRQRGRAGDQGHQRRLLRGAPGPPAPRPGDPQGRQRQGRAVPDRSGGAGRRPRWRHRDRRVVRGGLGRQRPRRSGGGRRRRAPTDQRGAHAVRG
jgi:hypothetical protein